MYKRSKTKQINNGKSKLRKINYESVGGFNENINEMDLDDLNNIDDFEDSSDSDSDSEMYGGDGTASTTKWEEEKIDKEKKSFINSKKISNVNSQVISKDIEKYITEREIKDFTDNQYNESIAEVFKSMVTNNKLNKKYDDKTIENQFVKIFNYFVKNRFNEAYETFSLDTELTPQKIAVTIQTEKNLKVGIKQSNLYLYNIDTYIEIFLGKLQSDTKLKLDAEKVLNDNYANFITKLLADANAGIKKHYGNFNINDNKIEMFMPHLLEHKSTDVFVGGSGDIIYKKNTKVDKDKLKIPSTYGDKWETISGDNTTTKKLYTINSRFSNIGTSVDATSPEVQTYFNKCEDLQIFYINKHILIHRLMSKMVNLIKYNITIAELIDTLTSPKEQIHTNGIKVKVNLKSILTDISKLYEDEKKILDSSKKIIQDPDIQDEMIEKKNKALAINSEGIPDTDIITNTATTPNQITINNVKLINSKYFLKNEYFIIKDKDIKGVDFPKYFGQITGVNVNIDGTLTIKAELKYNSNLDNINNNYSLAVVNYEDYDGNMKYFIDSNVMTLADKNLTNDKEIKFYLLKKGEYKFQHINITYTFRLDDDKLLSNENKPIIIKRANITPNTIPKSNNLATFKTHTDNTSKLVLDKYDDAENMFISNKKVSEFGNNIYFYEDKEINFDEFKAKIQENNTKLGIRFGDKLKNFRDYMFSEDKRYEITIDGKPYKIEKIDYQTERIVFKSKTEDNPITKESVISIPGLNKYRIKIQNIDKINKNITDKQTIYYSGSGSTPIPMIATFNETDRFTFLSNLNITLNANATPTPPINNKYNKIKSLVYNFKVTDDVNKFEKIDYYVSNLASYETIQKIDDIQKHNLASLKSVLGNKIKNKHSMETKIDEYERNIGEGSKITTHTKKNSGSGSGSGWQNFNTTNTKRQYFKNTLNKFSSETIQENETLRIQQVIYKCYDLQILYLMKHLEVIFINNVLFYYMDMLAKQVAVLLFILSLYKRYKTNISESNSVKITNLFTKFGENIFKPQQDVIVGGEYKFAGGAKVAAAVAAAGEDGEAGARDGTVEEGKAGTGGEEGGEEGGVTGTGGEEEAATEGAPATGEEGGKEGEVVRAPEGEVVRAPPTPPAPATVVEPEGETEGEVPGAPGAPGEEAPGEEAVLEPALAPAPAPAQAPASAQAQPAPAQAPVPAQAQPSAPEVEQNFTTKQKKAKAEYEQLVEKNKNQLIKEGNNLFKNFNENNLNNMSNDDIKTKIEELNKQAPAAIPAAAPQAPAAAQAPTAPTAPAQQQAQVAQQTHQTNQGGGAIPDFNEGFTNEEKISFLEKVKAFNMLNTILKNIEESTTLNDLNAILHKIDPVETKIFSLLKGDDIFKESGLSGLIKIAEEDKELQLGTSGKSSFDKKAATRIQTHQSIDEKIKKIDEIEPLKQNKQIFESLIRLNAKSDLTTDEKIKKQELIKKAFNAIQNSALLEHFTMDANDIQNKNFIELLTNPDDLKVLYDLKTTKIDGTNYKTFKKQLTDMQTKLTVPSGGANQQPNQSTNTKNNKRENLTFNQALLNFINAKLTEIDEFLKTDATAKQTAEKQTKQLELFNQGKENKFKDYSKLEEFINGKKVEFTSALTTYDKEITLKNKTVIETVIKKNNIEITPEEIEEVEKIIQAIKDSDVMKQKKADFKNKIDEMIKQINNDKFQKLVELMKIIKYTPNEGLTESQNKIKTEYYNDTFIENLNNVIDEIHILTIYNFETETKSIDQEIKPLVEFNKDKTKEKIEKAITDFTFKEKTIADLFKEDSYLNSIKPLSLCFDKVKHKTEDNYSNNGLMKLEKAIKALPNDIKKILDVELLFAAMKEANKIKTDIQDEKQDITDDTKYRELLGKIITFQKKNEQLLTQKNIRTLYETIAGAAMVIARIKPLIKHNSSPTLSEILTQSQVNTNVDESQAVETLKKFTVAKYLEYIKVKGSSNVEASVSNSGPKKYTKIEENKFSAIFTEVVETTNNDSSNKTPQAQENSAAQAQENPTSQEQEQAQEPANPLKQSAGYLYENVSKIEENGGLKIGKLCEANGIDINNTYGPYAGIYDPDFNNFDIYAFLFGTQPIQYEKTPSNNNTGQKETNINQTLPFRGKDTSTTDACGTDVGKTTCGRLPYNNNTPQNLIEKLNEKGNIVLFGYGFSGSGKTYALLEGKPYKSRDKFVEDPTKYLSQQYDPSLLELFIKDNSSIISKVEFVDIYPLGGGDNNKIKIFYGENAEANIKKIYGESFKDFSKAEAEYNSICKKSNGKESICEESINEASNGKDITYEEIANQIDAIATHRRKHLRILATPNNSESSRSFLQISIILNGGNKLVFFDMPGSENTVRIKAEFFKTVFNDVKQQGKVKEISQGKIKSITVDKGNTPGVNYENLTLYTMKNADPKESGKIRFIVKYKEVSKSHTEVSKSQTEELKYNNLIKSSLIDLSTMESICGLKITTEKTDDNKSKIFSEIMQKLSLFLNGYSVNSFEDIKVREIVNIPSFAIVEKIVKHFLSNAIFQDADINKDKTVFKYKFFTLEKKTNESHTSNFTIDENDKINITKIYEILQQQSSTNLYWNNIWNDENKNNFVSGSLLKFLNNDNSIKDDDTYTFNYNNDNKPNVMIKYFLKIINYIIKQNKEKKDKYGAILFFIYKYVNFIVKQGAAIVTNLEHLKFFFLSNTDNVKDYNKNNPDKAFTYEFDCNKTKCSNIINDPKRYTILTNVLEENNKLTPQQEKMDIDETVNMGQMEEYRLLSILQNLAKQDTNLNQLSHDTDNILNLNKSSAGNESGSNALFVMFTNLKIFRDDDIDKSSPTDKKPELKTICNAEEDTLKFADSISSSTQGKTEATAGGSLLSKIKKSPKKFNMKELTKKHKKQNRIQTVKKQLKTNNKKTLYSRHSKKYQK